MNRRRTSAVLLAATLSAAGVLVGPTIAAAAALPPGLALSVHAGPPTTTLSVTGSGYAAGEPVDVYVGTIAVGHGTATAAGALPATTIRIPAAAPPGTAPVLASGRSSHLTAQVPFVVRTDWAQPGFGPENGHADLVENTITPESVGSLHRAWSAIGSIETTRMIVANGLVVWATRKGIRAFVARSGALVWVNARYPGVTTDPVAANGLVYLAPGDSTLVALNIYTGQPKWVVPLPAGFDPPHLTYADGAVYTATYGGPLTKYDAATGARRWSVPSNSGRTGWASAFGLFFLRGVDGSVQARDVTTGALRWFRAGFRPVPGGLRVAVSGPNVLVDLESGLAALDARTGVTRWTQPSDGIGAGSDLVVTPQALFMEAQTLDPATGAVRRLYPAGVVGSPVVGGGLVYLQTTSDIAAVDTAGLALVTRIPVPDATATEIADGVLYVLRLDRVSNISEIVALVPPATPAAWVTLDDKAPATGPNHLTYSAGWSSGINPADYRGSDSYTSKTGATASFTFTGTGFRVWFSAAGHHGIASVSAERATPSGPVRTVFAVDEYSGTRRDGITSAVSPPLPFGTYTVTVRATGTHNPASTGSVISVDRIDLGRL